MASWYQTLLAPRLEEARLRRREVLLYLLTLSALAASVLWLASGVTAILLWGRHFRLEGDIYVGLEGIAVSGLAYVLTRHGLLLPASYVALFGVLVMQVSSMLLIWQSPLDPTMVFYAVVIAMGGLLLGRRGAILFYVLSLVCYLATAGGLFLSGKRVVEVKEFFTLGLTTIALAFILSILLLVVHFYISSMEGALNQAEEQVRERTSQLEATYRDLAEQHTRLDVILRNVADGLVVTDQDNLVVLVNPVFARIVGHPLPELTGRRLGETLGTVGLVRIVRQARESPGSAFAANVTVATRVYQAVACALGGDDTPLSGVVTVLHDITQEIEAIETRTQFVSSVAHELRVPLTSIRGYADLLVGGGRAPLLPEQQAFVQIILRNVERMATLVYDLLDLCHLETGRVQMEIGPASLRTAVEEVAVAMRPQMADKNLALEVQLPDNLSFVLADSRRLNQVLTNLLSNACKYTPDGGRVTIRARSLPLPQSNPDHYPKAEAKYLEVAVQDTGVGIAPQDQERIFDRFVRLDNPLVEKAGGTGLGLTIVRQLLALQGGQVWVESALGAGSTFYFSLPVAE
jgi:PAS domain S-box-containing protein